MLIVGESPAAGENILSGERRRGEREKFPAVSTVEIQIGNEEVQIEYSIFTN